MASGVRSQQRASLLSTEIPAGNGQTAVCFQVTHERLMECATANLQQVVIGVGSKKFKSFHYCVSCVCLVEGRRRKETGGREGGHCTYFTSLLNLVTKDSRSTPASTIY